MYTITNSEDWAMLRVALGVYWTQARDKDLADSIADLYRRMTGPVCIDDINIIFGPHPHITVNKMETSRAEEISL